MTSNSVFQTYPANQSSLQLQYSNVQISISSAPGVFFPFIMSVEYSDTNDVAEGRGISPYPMGTTLGEYKASGSLEVQRAYSDQFLSIIAAQSPGGQTAPSLYDSIFDITVAYQIRVPQGQQPIPVQQDVLRGCRLTGQAQSLSVGNNVLSVKFTLYVALIIWSGRLPLAGLPQ